MDGNKSLLQQIREKESDLGQKLELATKETEQIAADARRDAEEIVRSAERDGAAAREGYLREEREKLDREIMALREGGRKESAAIRQRAEARMPLAMEMITRAVSLGPEK